MMSTIASHSSPTHPVRGLLASDVDSTLVEHEAIDLLAEYAGCADRMAALTQRAMRGDVDFRVSLTERVRLLAGVRSSVLKEAAARMRAREGARELVQEAQARHWHVVLISGGFIEMLEPLGEFLGVHDVVANSLEVRHGVLTGHVVGEIVTPAVKARVVRARQDTFDVDRAHTLVMGDGANDLEMMDLAAVSVGVDPKPIVRARATHVVEGGLDPVIQLLRHCDEEGSEQRGLS